MFAFIIVVFSDKVSIIPNFILIGCCVSELKGRLCTYHNVWPEAVYCCFIRTTLFTTTSTFIIVVCSDKGMYNNYCLLCECVKRHKAKCPYRNVWPKAVYCVLQELHCLPNCLHTCIIRVRGCYHVTKFCCTTSSSF